MSQSTVSQTNPLRSDERGLVSITITVILMLVISLTVLSFAQLVRREQRQALDQQLSSQAFYAAESGINDAQRYIANNYGGTTPPPKTTCANTASYDLSTTVDAASNTKYTCVLIDASPKSLKYDLSTTEQAKVFPINAASTITSLDLSWTPETATNPTVGCVGSATLPSGTVANPWPCTGYGMLRIDLVPINAIMTRTSLEQSTFTAFITPVASGALATVQYSNPANGSNNNIYDGTANQGIRPNASCDAISCRITITGLSNTKYYARVSTLYRKATLSVTAKDASNNVLPLTGAQIMIDSTGQAQDVVRRVQVRVPVLFDGLHSDFAIQSSTSMCKAFSTYPSASFSNGANNNTPC